MSSRGAAPGPRTHDARPRHDRVSDLITMHFATVGHMLADAEEERRNSLRAAARWGVPLVAVVALVVHSRHFDFVCDDAFIALRQA